MECVARFILIFITVTYPLKANGCFSEVHSDIIDLEEDYEDQQGIGWAINVEQGHEWFYSDTWPGLDGTGIFKIDSNSGQAGQIFNFVALFVQYGDNHVFDFELKYYSEAAASLHNVIIDGVFQDLHYLSPSNELEWTVIQFQAEGPLLPDMPQLQIRIPANQQEFFLMESLSTTICDVSVTGTTEVTTVETTSAEPTTTDPTTIVSTSSEPTSAEPTTSEPTSAESTTSEPTSAEPTTSEPTPGETSTLAPSEPTTAPPFLQTTPTSPTTGGLDTLFIVLISINSALAIVLALVIARWCCCNKRRKRRSAPNVQVTLGNTFCIPRARTLTQNDSGVWLT